MIFSGVATLVPPNFWTMMLMATESCLQGKAAAETRCGGEPR
jgi:hypothetical protein